MTQMPDTHLAELLSQFEAAVRATGCPYFDFAGPGAAMSDIEAALDSVGLPLVPDIATFFSWHNGKIPGSIAPRLTPTEIVLPRLELALDDYSSLVDAELGPTTWFPIMGYTYAGLVGLDTSRVSDTGASPIRHYDFQFGWHIHEVSSLTIPLTWWIEYLRDGTWRWNSEYWESDLDNNAVSPERRDSHMV
jgi:hypothetical protein